MTLNRVNQMNENPWKALMPYELEDKNIFFGRDKEIAELTSLIEYNQVVTLYGKSGVGKSSLLNAGVSPRLTMDGLKPFTIRLKSETDFESTDVSFAEMILSHLSKKKKNIDYTSKDVFCRFFEKYESYNDYGEKIIPVIILDQFEDTLIHNEAKAELLLKQIVAWTNNKLEVASDCHFVISIREDDLYLLEEVLDKNRLNALKLSRYRLRNIRREGAEEIIRKGGKEIIKEDSIVDRILQMLGKDFTGNYEASELSLMCYQLYELMAKQGMSYISVEMVEKNGISSIKEYYKSIISGLKMSEDEIKSLEKEFVTDSGRRSFISEDKYQKLFRQEVCDNLVNPQSRYRILSKTNGKVEIVHDLLAKAIKAVKDEHDADNLQRIVKQEKFICYLSLLPVLLVVLLTLYNILPPVLVFLNGEGISSIYDIMDFPDLMDKALWLLAIPFLWWMPWIVLKRGKYLENINLNYVYQYAGSIYLGIILVFVWLIYKQEELLSWAPGVNILPFVACGLWFKDINRKELFSLPFLFLLIALCFSLPFISKNIQYNNILTVVYVISGLLFYDKIKMGFKIVISLLMLLIGVVFYEEGNQVFLFISIWVLTLILVYVSFKKQKNLCVFYSLMIIGTVIGVCRINPYYLIKYCSNISDIIPNTVIITSQSDSVYIKDAWNGKNYINLPLIAKNDCPFGILPVSDSLTMNSIGPFYPFTEFIVGDGYKIHVDELFYRGIYGKLKEDLDYKLEKLSDNPKRDNFDPYYNIKKEILFPIKLNVIEMFNNLMVAVNENIRNQISLSSVSNNHYNKIDSLCRIYLNGFKEKNIGERMSESDLYYYYRIAVCQLSNTLLQESINRNDLHNTIRWISFILYLNLSEENMYSNINTRITININNPYIDDSIKSFHVSGNIVDDKMEISKIRDLFDMVSSLAAEQQAVWLTNDIENITDSLKSAEKKNLFISAMSYDNNPYLKSFYLYQNELFECILSEMNSDNDVYRSYFEKVARQLMFIQFLNSETFLRNIYESKKDQLNYFTEKFEKDLIQVENLSKLLINSFEMTSLLEKLYLNLKDK